MNSFIRSKKIYLIPLFFILLTVAIVIVCVFLWQGLFVNQSQNNVLQEQKITELPSQFSQKQFSTVSETEPIIYYKNDQLFIVSKQEFAVLDQFTSSQLKAQSQECGESGTEQDFSSLLSQYTRSDQAIQYSFQYQGQSQDSGLWIVTVIPNKLGYTGNVDFKKDFGICAAGSEKYPSMVSKKYLLFVSSCGSGFDDGSGRPFGCEKVKQAVEPTMRLR